MKISGAFTLDQVARLTGLSKRQIAYWDSTGVYSPSLIARGRPFGRVYSFRDVVALRTLALIRGKVPLQEIRRVGHWLLSHYQDPWSTLRFYVRGRQIFYSEPGTGIVRAPDTGRQSTMLVELEPIAETMEERFHELQQRETDEIGRITRNRYVVHNAFVIAGTRIPTDLVVELHQAGYDTPAILREYPDLTPEDVSAALEFEEHRAVS